MLTFVKDKSATEVVSIYKKGTRSVKPVQTVYFTHDGKETGNVAAAAGVLALHKDSLKKLHKLSNAAFDRICVMLDTGLEPEISGDPHRPAYWEVRAAYERALRNEIYLGDQDDL